MGQTKQIIIKFETFSLLVTSIVNKRLYLTFIITNTRSAVALAKIFFVEVFFLWWRSLTKYAFFLLKFFSCAEWVWLNIHSFRNHFDSGFVPNNIVLIWCPFKFTFNPIQDWVGRGKKALHTSFSLVTSTNGGISPKNFLTFSFNPVDTGVKFQGHT